MLKISKTARISPLARICDSIKGTCIEIGDGVFIDAYVSIKPIGGIGDLVIGKNCDINSGTVIFTGNGIQIGDNVLIAPNCTFAASNHCFADPLVPIRQQGFMKSRGGIIVEDDVWIGANCCILDGAILRKGCVIGAGSMVNKEVAAFSIQAGNPCKQIGMRVGQISK